MMYNKDRYNKFVKNSCGDSLAETYFNEGAMLRDTLRLLLTETHGVDCCGMSSVEMCMAAEKIALASYQSKEETK